MLQNLFKGMKTSQVLSRKMGKFVVHQRTNDAMFNATSLLKQWNESSKEEKELDIFFNKEAVQEFIEILVERNKLGKNKYPYLVTRGKNSSIWMDPMLFIDFAMWINPLFKYDVLKFVYDQLIEIRNEAGNTYKDLSSAICRIVNKNDIGKIMSHVAKAINYIIYNNHKKQLRNIQADELHLKELCELQKDITKLINFGFIKSYNQLIDFLNKRWIEKWNPKELRA